MNGVSLPETVVAANAALTGQLQSSLGDLGPSLTELDLEGNSMITGSVPTEVGLLGGLEILNLKQNSLNGVLPTEVGALTSLEDLLLCCNSLDGSLPTEFGALTNLVDLDLSSNQLTGVPTEFRTINPSVGCGLQLNSGFSCANVGFGTLCCTSDNCGDTSTCSGSTCAYTDTTCAAGSTCPGGTLVSAECADRSAFDENPCACTALEELAALSSDLGGKAPWATLASASYCTVPEGDYSNFYYDYDYTDMDLQVKCTPVILSQSRVFLPQGGEWCFPFTAREWRTAGKARD